MKVKSVGGIWGAERVTSGINFRRLPGRARGDLPALSP
jgi:hypothetical protein